ncbi:MAG: PAS domain S-box protein, partial [Bacteroidales bacterium]|nr:PAS domain S-box protein [Bacteroidales bacterium]
LEITGTPSQAWLGVPLKVEGKMLGAIVVQNYDNPDVYDQTSIEIMELVAHELSIFIDRQHSEEKAIKLSRAVEQSSVSVMITNREGTIEYVNPFFSELTGYSFEEVIGKNSNILKSGHQSTTFYQELWSTILSGNNWKGEFLNKKKTGELFWVKAVISPILNNEGVITNFVSIREDITRSKKMIEELVAAKEKAEENEAKFRSLFNRVADAIFIYDPNTFEIIEANEATSRIYGYHSGELIGMSVLKFSAEVEKSKYAAENIERKGEMLVNFRHHKRKDGADLFVQLQGYKIVVDNKPLTFAVCHDITEVVKSEQDLIAAKEKAQESDNLKTAFINNISHEIRTPLNGILGFGEFLVEPGLPPETKKEMLEVVKQSSNRLINTVTDYMDMARIVSGTMEVHKKEFLLNPFFKEVTEKTRQLCAGKQISFEVA